MDDLQCCPICHGNNLSTNTWYIHDEEVDAVECNDCYCGAPLDTWQQEDAELEECCDLVTAAGLSTGHGESHVELIKEVLNQVRNMRSHEDIT